MSSQPKPLSPASLEKFAKVIVNAPGGLEAVRRQLLERGLLTRAHAVHPNDPKVQRAATASKQNGGKKAKKQTKSGKSKK